jgi:hypothetical protein
MSDMQRCPVTGRPVESRTGGRPQTYVNQDARELAARLEQVRILLGRLGSQLEPAARVRLRQTLFSMLNQGALRPPPERYAQAAQKKGGEEV